MRTDEIRYQEWGLGSILTTERGRQKQPFLCGLVRTDNGESLYERP
jgi:hypothetical protein